MQKTTIAELIKEIADDPELGGNVEIVDIKRIIKLVGMEMAASIDLHCAILVKGKDDLYNGKKEKK